GNQIVHTIDPAQQRGLAATGGSDVSGDALFGDGHVDIVQSMELAVPAIELAHHESDGQLFRSRLLAGSEVHLQSRRRHTSGRRLGTDNVFTLGHGHSCLWMVHPNDFCVFCRISTAAALNNSSTPSRTMM